MIALVQGEMIKVRTTRTALGFSAAAVLLVLAVVLITILAGDPTTAQEKKDALNVGGALSVPLLLFGIVGATGEFRHRTIAPAVLISPNRGRLTLARLIAYVFTAALVGVAMVVVALAIGLPLLSGQPGPSMETGDYTAVIGGGILTSVLCCALGVGIGVLIRNQVAGVVGSLVWLLILEPLLPLIADDLAKGSILNAAGALGGAQSDDLTWAGALLVLGVWAGVFVIAGLLVDARRDVE